MLLRQQGALGAEVHRVERRIGEGPLSISRVVLAMFLDAHGKALMAFHAGDWTNDLVASLRVSLPCRPDCSPISD
jgi:hypothetical protein